MSKSLIFKEPVFNSKLSTNYVLHIGPTNSGKTYNAIQDLKEKGGVYLAPLRLLAWEIYDKLNAEGYRTNLITGEEIIDHGHPFIISSTIEMMNYSVEHECVVIDECFMIGDRDRGKAWLKALTSSKAKTVHVICNIESEKIIETVLRTIGIKTIIKHNYKRLVPLETGGSFKISKPPKRTILVTFSRIDVLVYKMEYENKGYKVAILYGNLPPEVKKNEIERFNSGEADICISTDVIGMGLNLPCDNVIFLESEKFDGITKRTLTSMEVKQIAGRAGRYKLSEKGFVKFADSFLDRLLGKTEYITKAYIGMDYNLFKDVEDTTMKDLIKLWLNEDFIPDELQKIVFKESVDKYINLINDFTEKIHLVDKDLAWSLVYLPVKKQTEQVYIQYCEKVFKNELILRPEMPKDYEIKDITKLEEIESCLAEFDLFKYTYNTKRLNPFCEDINTDDLEEDREILIEAINKFLLDRTLSGKKKCKGCGKNIGILNRHLFCDNCFYDS